MRAPVRAIGTIDAGNDHGLNAISQFLILEFIHALILVVGRAVGVLFPRVSSASTRRLGARPRDAERRCLEVIRFTGVA